MNQVINNNKTNLLKSGPKVSIIILNWNGWEDTIECLESVYQNIYLNYDVIVVDNASTDDSIEKIKKYAKGAIKVSSPYIKYTSTSKPKHIFEYEDKEVLKEHFEIDPYYYNISPHKKLILIKNNKNYGFAGGCNIGIKLALKLGAKYIHLLNNDAVVDKCFLYELVRVMENDKKIGIASSKILDYGNPSLIQSTGGHLNLWLGLMREYTWIPDDLAMKVTEVDFVWGTSILIRRDVFETIGLLDANFFFKAEDYEFCIRARKHGYKVVYVPTSVIYHKGGASFKKLNVYDPNLKRAILKSWGFMNYKYYKKLFKKYLPPLIYYIPLFNLILQKIIINLIIEYIRKSLKAHELERIKKIKKLLYNL